MNLLDKVLNYIVKRYFLSQYGSETAEMFGARPSSAGVSVNESNVMSATAVFAAVRILASTLASLPLPVYKKLKPRGKVRDPDHPLYAVIHDIANPEMTAMQYREMLMFHCLLKGTHYAYIERNGAEQITALWPLNPWKTYPLRDTNGELWYITTLPNGEQRKLQPREVFKVAGISADGLTGIDPVKTFKETFGLTMAIERFAAKFFGNGAKLSGILEHPGKLSQEAQERLRANLERIHAGLENAHKIAILEEGMKWHQISTNPEEAQMLEGRKFQVAEVSRIFGVPPHLLADLERATFSNIEHQSIELVIYSLRPWCVRIEQAIYMQLLTPLERRRFFVEHVIDGLLRGDIKSRYEAYAIAIDKGILSRNEVRELENQNPVDGGDEYYVPLNTMPVSMVKDFWQSKIKGGVAGETGAPNIQS